MQMLKCPVYTTCKYFYNQTKIVHFRAKHRLLDFCKQTLNEQQCLMYKKGNTHKNFVTCKTSILVHMCNLVHSLSVGILQFYINQSMCSHFRIYFPFGSMFETERECTLIKRNLACSMITISEKATPMTLLQGDGSLVQL